MFLNKDAHTILFNILVEEKQHISVCTELFFLISLSKKNSTYQSALSSSTVFPSKRAMASFHASGMTIAC